MPVHLHDLCDDWHGLILETTSTRSSIIRGPDVAISTSRMDRIPGRQRLKITRSLWFSVSRPPSSLAALVPPRDSVASI